jgi:hypothetical protein
MNALRAGEDPPPPDPIMAAVGAAMIRDADVFRGVMETVTCLALPQEVFARPGMADKVAAHAGQSTFVAPGPDREELLRLVS